MTVLDSKLFPRRSEFVGWLVFSGVPEFSIIYLYLVFNYESDRTIMKNINYQQDILLFVYVLMQFVSFCVFPRRWCEYYLRISPTILSSVRPTVPPCPADASAEFYYYACRIKSSSYMGTSIDRSLAGWLAGWLATSISRCNQLGNN